MTDSNTDLQRQILVNFVRDELFEKAVLGLIFGIGSAPEGFVVAEAISKENLHSIVMPYEFSNAESKAHDRSVVQTCEVSFSVVSITPMVGAYLEQLPDADIVWHDNKTVAST